MSGLYTYKAVITSVYDGDTATATIDLGFSMAAVKVKLRFYGINTPEIRGGTELTKKAGKVSRDHVKERILGKTVLLHSVGKGKYGRFLATIWPLDEQGNPLEESINDELIRLGLAEPYMK